MNPENQRFIILAALDRSPASDWVGRAAAALAAKVANAEVHVVHVETAPSALEGTVAVAERVRDAHEFVHRVVHDLAAATNAKVAGHVAVGSPRKHILQIAADVGADIVIVGSHRKSTADRWLLGSVSQAVVQDAPCAVLVARPKDASMVPEIEPPCPACLKVQAESSGATLWCSQHATRFHHLKGHDGSGAGASVSPTSLGGTSVFIRT